MKDADTLLRPFDRDSAVFPERSWILSYPARVRAESVTWGRDSDANGRLVDIATVERDACL